MTRIDQTNSLPTVVYYIYEEGFRNFRMGYAITVAWVLLVDDPGLHPHPVPPAEAMGALLMTTHRPLRYYVGRIGLHIVLLTVGIIFMLPFVWSISTSLKPMSELFRSNPA